MQDRLILLVREVERVVTAPYVPSLQVSLSADNRSPAARISTLKMKTVLGPLWHCLQCSFLSSLFLVV